MKLAVLGSGSWGSALSVHFGRLGFEVFQWCREGEVVEEINRKRKNTLFLPGVVYPETVRATSRVSEAVEGADYVLSVIPTQHTSNFWKDNRAAKINNIRIRTNLNASDIVIVKFGEKY
ncbi:MAG: YtoQ family protein, partial [Desulfurobacteriaceae bacterium]